MVRDQICMEKCWSGRIYSAQLTRDSSSGTIYTAWAYLVRPKASFCRCPEKFFYLLASATLACATFMESLSSLMTVSGSSAPNIAVPATITLLPEKEDFKLRVVFQEACIPASVQTPTVLGPTPPSTSISLSGKRARSSATFGTHRSINF